MRLDTVVESGSSELTKILSLDFRSTVRSESGQSDKGTASAVNDTLLTVYSTRTVFDKVDTDKIFFIC